MGGYALASGVPIRRFLEGPGFQRLLRWSALAAVILHRPHRRPRRPTPSTSRCSAPRLRHRSAPMPPRSSSPIGVIGFLLELAKEHRNRLNLLCVVPLALSPFFAYQRAVLITLGSGRDRRGAGGPGVHAPAGACGSGRGRSPSRPWPSWAWCSGCRSSPPSRPEVGHRPGLEHHARSTLGDTLELPGRSSSVRPGPAQQVERGPRRRQTGIRSSARGSGSSTVISSAGAEPIHHDRPHREHRARPVAADRPHRVGPVPPGPRRPPSPTVSPPGACTPTGWWRCSPSPCSRW